MPKVTMTTGEKAPERRRVTAADRKRRELRDHLWPGSADWIWSINDRDNVGFATVPRLLPLVLHLIKILVAGDRSGDPSPALFELWCRDFGQSLISISDEEKCAYASGYSSTRARRTWRTHMQKLVDLGFIQAKADGNREFGHVLLLNPLGVCARLRGEKKVPDEWWTAFVSRASEISAKVPAPLLLPGMPGYAVETI